MNDQLERLFADLRSETMATIMPPGVDAARTTVRRRRMRRTAVGAGLAVLLASGVGLGVAKPLRPAPPAQPGTPLSLDARKSLALDAARAIRLNSWPQVTGGTITDDVSVGLQVIPREYDFVAACVGDTGTVDLSAGDTHLSLPCARNPVQQKVRVTFTGERHQILVGAHADRAAAGRVGVAWALNISSEEMTRMQTEAGQLVGENASTSWLEVGDGEEDDTARAGVYRITIACVGTGSVRARVGNTQLTPSAKPLKTYDQPCDGTVGRFDVTMPAGTKLGTFEVRASEDARNRAAVGYRVERI
ncbi:hypothetical protein GCM10010168_10500 [Actinoplanes ianthinogenes]|uniref:Uncharacterized protein n=1 Tax=Actinoplanes ianthinogenes TaxID=122358 RepID=A0ABN6CFI1_9ACTN|nr:hypothetical protein [Actinoplanes ianthinogenes]BCJ44237.1 hypothetical protein Aiant_48940 [Actinoplanes ianthinogenes]GGQ96706.1 hypothetical protein GCM10010168_10500 [Actinoplanes ianthinogenes]